MVATKLLDALSRCPGFDGEDSDAKGAYHQVLLKEAEELLGPGVFIDTWVTIPRNQYPENWEGAKMANPVVPLLRNLYGHKLAGLLWQRFPERKI